MFHVVGREILPRADILWEAWRQVKANQGAPGIDRKAIDEIVETGQEAGMIKKLQEALCEHRYQFAPVRVVDWLWGQLLGENRRKAGPFARLEPKQRRA